MNERRHLTDLLAQGALDDDTIEHLRGTNLDALAEALAPYLREEEVLAVVERVRRLQAGPAV